MDQQKTAQALIQWMQLGNTFESKKEYRRLRGFLLDTLLPTKSAKSHEISLFIHISQDCKLHHLLQKTDPIFTERMRQKSEDLIGPKGNSFVAIWDTVVKKNSAAGKYAKSKTIDEPLIARSPEDYHAEKGEHRLYYATLKQRKWVFLKLNTIAFNILKYPSEAHFVMVPGSDQGTLSWKDYPPLVQKLKKLSAVQPTNPQDELPERMDYYSKLSGIQRQVPIAEIIEKISTNLQLPHHVAWSKHPDTWTRWKDCPILKSLVEIEVAEKQLAKKTKPSDNTNWTLLSYQSTSTEKACLLRDAGTPYETQFALTGELYTIGRGQDNDLQIKNDSKVSRHHCKLFRRSGHFYIEDTKSSNGTLVNGELIRERRLYGGEEILVGESRFRFRFDILPPSTAKPKPLKEQRTQQLATDLEVYLVWQKEGGNQVIPLDDRPYTIGRGDDNNLSLRGDEAVSRNHCTIQKQHGQYYITDLQSSNGTFVNDQPIQEHLLLDGERLTIGHTSLFFRLREVDG